MVNVILIKKKYNTFKKKETLLIGQIMLLAAFGIGNDISTFLILAGNNAIYIHIFAANPSNSIAIDHL